MGAASDTPGSGVAVHRGRGGVFDTPLLLLLAVCRVVCDSVGESSLSAFKVGGLSVGAAALS